MTLLGITLAVGELAIGIAIGWWLRSRQLGVGLGDHGEGGGFEGLRSIATDVSQATSIDAQSISHVQSQLAAMDRESLSKADEAVVDAMSWIAEANTKLQAELDKARGQVASHAEIAGTDTETGLPNRKGFDADLGRRFAQWEQDETPLSMIVIDVDNLAEIEEEHGQQASDAVIRGLADVLCQATREMDVVARYDDHEFAVMLPDTNLKGARTAAAKVRKAVTDRSFETDDKVPLEITISEGVVEAIEGDDIKSLSNRAGRALDSARDAGRDQAHAHDGTVCRPIADDGNVEEHAAGFVDVDLQSQSDQVSTQATDPRIDPLTGQLSRRAFSDYVREQVVEHAGAETSLSLALIEIDAIDRLITKHGQAIADVVVRTITQIICTATRNHDQVARYDHGTLALVSGIPIDDATLVVERIRRAVGACKLRAGSSDLMVTVSVGVAQATAGEDSVALMSHADTALKSARIAGRNCTHSWNAEKRAAGEAMLVAN